MKRKVIIKLTKFRNTIREHYKEFEVIDNLSVYKSDLLKEMIKKEKEEVEEIDKLIEWMRNDCKVDYYPSWIKRLRRKKNER